MREQIDQALRGAGLRHRAVGMEVLEEIEETFAMLLGRGLLSPEIHEEYRESLDFVAPSDMGEPRSLIVVATPSPPLKVRFELEDGSLEAVIPPTYVSSEARARCLRSLQEILVPAGYSVAETAAPKRLLAVRTGLAEYGRNNIAYVMGRGSHHRLDVYATDADLVPPGARRGGMSRFIVGGRDPVTGHWSLPRRMGSCSACKACHHACPTGCIPHPDDGDVIDATRCLTYLNEHEGEWPEWLDPGSHNALIGCMVCQRTCPANRVNIHREEVVAVFDREETEMILRETPWDGLTADMRRRLATLDLREYYPVICRNLTALVDRDRPPVRGRVAGA